MNPFLPREVQCFVSNLVLPALAYFLCLLKQLSWVGWCLPRAAHGWGKLLLQPSESFFISSTKECFITGEISNLLESNERMERNRGCLGQRGCIYPSWNIARVLRLISAFFLGISNENKWPFVSRLSLSASIGGEKRIHIATGS